MSLEFRTLDIFQAVAMLNSFGRAADTLHMTQSAVSQRIGNLEAELGSRLFDRTKRGASLTPKGHLLLGYCKRLLATRTEMIEALADMRPQSSMIRLGVSETIAQLWLSDFIVEVNARFPFVTFEIEVDVSSNLRARLLRQELDLVFLLGNVVEPGIGNVKLCSYPLRFVASPSLRFDANPVTPAAMARHAMICFPRNTIIYGILQQMFQEQAVQAPQIHCSSSVATIIKMTLDRIGISLLTPALIKTELADRRLVILDTPVTLPCLEFGASYQMNSANGTLPMIADVASSMAKNKAKIDKFS